MRNECLLSGTVPCRRRRNAEFVSTHFNRSQRPDLGSASHVLTPTTPTVTLSRQIQILKALFKKRQSAQIFSAGGDFSSLTKRLVVLNLLCLLHFSLSLFLSLSVSVLQSLFLRMTRTHPCPPPSWSPIILSLSLPLCLSLLICLSLSPVFDTHARHTIHTYTLKQIVGVGLTSFFSRRLVACQWCSKNATFLFRLKGTLDQNLKQLTADLLQSVTKMFRKCCAGHKFSAKNSTDRLCHRLAAERTALGVQYSGLSGAIRAHRS